MNYLDTGEDYEDGLSEELLSKIICNKRDKVVVGSKFIPSNNSYNNVISACESSLKRLKTDYIDLYQIHWPQRQTNYFGQLNYKYSKENTNEIIDNFDVPQLSKVVKYDILNKFSVLQTEYDLFNRQVEDEIFDFNKINKITTLAYMSLGKDFLFLVLQLVKPCNKQRPVLRQSTYQDGKLQLMVIPLKQCIQINPFMLMTRFQQWLEELIIHLKELMKYNGHKVLMKKN